MNDSDPWFRVSLWGTFRLRRRDGTRIAVSSKKGMALLAMLATAPDGERTRSWLRDQLWGSRGRQQAQQSLRRELVALRPLLQSPAGNALSADGERLRLDPALCRLDRSDQRSGAAFLEGFDIPGEEGFEDWLREERGRSAPQATGTEATPLEPLVDVAQPAPGFGGRPAIAVVPIRNETADEQLRYWAEGLSEDIIQLLSRLRWLPVIAESTMVHVAGVEDSSLGVARAVGAGYVLRGRIVGPEAEPALHLSLLEATRGQLLWSESFRLKAQNAAHLVSELVGHVVAILASRIENAEQLRTLDRSLDALEPHELIWRARYHMKRLTRADAAIAREALAHAAQLFPLSPEVLVQQSWAMAWDVWAQRRPRQDIERFRALAERARDIDPFDARSYMLLGMADLWLRRYDTARELLREALRLNPSLINAHGNLGSTLYLSDSPAEALVPLRTGLRLSPYDTEAFYLMGELAMSHLMIGEHEQAVEQANAAVSRRRAYLYAHVIKITALGALDDRDAARLALANLRLVRPAFSPAELDWIPFRDRSWLDRLKDGLARAGQTGG
ncbi:MAG: hypothetical protein ABW203_06845 [Novosphingobium sp.]